MNIGINGMKGVHFLKKLLSEVKICPVKSKDGQIKYYKLRFVINPTIRMGQEDTVKKIVQLVNQRVPQRVIAEQLGISQSKVSKYLRKGRLNGQLMERES